MAPIRVAIIGLSAGAITSWAAEGHLPYLISPRGSAHYQIVALLNSSVEAAQRAIGHFNLPASTRAYGDPEALAADPDIDLVICNTRVDVHYKTTLPSLRAGKYVFIEWPLTQNLATTLSLTGNEPRDHSIIGLQGRLSPITLKLKDVLKSGRIGKVLSSDIRAFGSLSRRDGFSEGLTYFAEYNVGGNPITIAFGHMLDYVHDVLGEFESFESRMQIQRPQLNVYGGDVYVDENSQVTRTITSDVPDLLVMQGQLQKGKRDVVDGATLSITYRTGPPFKGQSPMVWTINGEKGELLISSPGGPYLMSHAYDGAQPTIQLHDHATDKVLDIEWDWEDWQKELPEHSRIVAQLYERFAWWYENGKPEGDLGENREWPHLSDAVERMRFFDTLFKRFNYQLGTAKY